MENCAYLRKNPGYAPEPACFTPEHTRKSAVLVVHKISPFPISKPFCTQLKTFPSCFIVGYEMLTITQDDFVFSESREQVTAPARLAAVLNCGHLAPDVQTMDSAIHWINHYPADKH